MSPADCLSESEPSSVSSLGAGITIYKLVLGGDCVVALVEMDKRILRSLQYAAPHENRLFLIANEKAKGMFVSNKGKYANADVAFNRKCSECRVEMNRDISRITRTRTN